MGTGDRVRALMQSIALRWATLTSHASTFVVAGNVGQAPSAARKVSDHASSASGPIPSIDLHTRRTVAPWSSTAFSKGVSMSIAA